MRPQELAEQIADFARPCRMMIAAGRTRRPGALPSLGTSAQNICIGDVEAAATQTEFADGIHRGEETFAKPRHVPLRLRKKTRSAPVWPHHDRFSLNCFH